MNLHHLGAWLVPLLLAASVSQTLVAADLPPPAALPSSPEFPDPLAMFSGKVVANRSVWERKRKPELLKLFAHYMYGTMPPKPRGLRMTVDGVYHDALGGKATLKLVSIRLGVAGAPVEHLMVVIPKEGKGGRPAFLGLNFSGNHEVLGDPRIPLPAGWVPTITTKVTNSTGAGGTPEVRTLRSNTARESDRGIQTATWAVEETIDRGYAFACFYSGDVEPDQDGATTGIRAWYKLKHGDKYDWGAIAAWAWGLQRAIDYLSTDTDIDARRIAVVGHSRMGKAAMLAGATDPRAALVIPLQAGCGGTAPSRSTLGESVQRINTSFPHWFNASFKEFNEHTDRIPFDQHCLAALCAPRPVLFATAQEDTWANPPGQFEMLKLAAPVYRLYGKDGLETAEMPPLNTLSSGRLGFFIRPGKHSMTTGDWKVFLDYADRWLK